MLNNVWKRIIQNKKKFSHHLSRLTRESLVKLTLYRCSWITEFSILLASICLPTDARWRITGATKLLSKQDWKWKCRKIYERSKCNFTHDLWRLWCLAGRVKFAQYFIQLIPVVAHNRWLCSSPPSLLHFSELLIRLDLITSNRLSAI